MKCLRRLLLALRLLLLLATCQYSSKATAAWPSLLEPWAHVLCEGLLLLLLLQ
jgi:hypothetical protein